MRAYSFFSIIFVFFLLISCFKESKKEIKLQKKINTNEAIRLDFISALDQYGVPESIEQFNNSGEKGTVFPGIRAGINNFFPPGSKKTEILESIWSKNDSINIAIWYTKKQNKWIPFDHFEYGKDWDF